MPQYAAFVPLVLEHHERFDGTGYPQKIAGSAISLGARILAVADVFNAMSSDRPYRKAVPMTDVVDYIESRAGTLFDPAAVAAFLRLVRGGPSSHTGPASASGSRDGAPHRLAS